MVHDLHLVLADAVHEGLRASNPAARRRGRGKRASRSHHRAPGNHHPAQQVTAIDVLTAGGPEPVTTVTGGHLARLRGLATARIGDPIGTPPPGEPWPAEAEQLAGAVRKGLAILFIRRGRSACRSSRRSPRA